MSLTSKVLSIESNRSYTGRFGLIYEFDITLEDGTKGIFTTTKNPQDKFTVGEIANYSIEVMTNKKDGKQYNKINKVAEIPQGGTGKDDLVARSILASVCLECACIVVDKMSLEENINSDLKSLHVLADKFYEYIESKGNDVQTRINYQSRLKQVVNHMIKYPNLKIENSTEILNYVEKEVEYIREKIRK